MHKNPHVPDVPWTPSPAFLAWLDVACDGYPNADRVPVPMLLLMQRRIHDDRAKREAKRREG
jgi:hypothetical protein